MSGEKHTMLEDSHMRVREHKHTKIPNSKPHSFSVDYLNRHSKTVRIRKYAYDKCVKISARTGRPISEIVSMAIELIE